MKHFPVFVALEGRRVVVSGGGEAALAKLRLLLKTEARLTVVAADVSPEIERLARDGRLRILRRAMEPGDALCARLFYAANDDDIEDARVAALAHRDGALVNWVDNLEQSQFITPAIVDRDPVTVAIGTEGAAPVLARAIKKDLEEKLPARLGLLARIGKAFRPMAEALPMGAKRRTFWSDFYFKAGPQTADQGEEAVEWALNNLLAEHLHEAPKEGHVFFVGAGPGDPDLLTMKARRLLHEADVIVHDRLVAPEILELARREALFVDVGKEGFGPSTLQSDIDSHLVRLAGEGHSVVRLKSGDPSVYGRLDEEIDAVAGAGIAYTVVPGITAASAAAAHLGQSLTARGRNSELRFVTGHDMKGFAEHDWRSLAKPGAVAAIYMGKRAARFVQGRLTMYGAAAETPISIVENASRPDAHVIGTTLGALPQSLAEADVTGPAVLILGLAPRAAVSALPELAEKVEA